MKYIPLLLFISIQCRAEIPEELIHDNTQYVDDYAGVFTAQQKQQLNAMIHGFFDTVQISVVTVNTLSGLEPYEFATRLGNKWGVGSKSSNGLLMLVCPAEHKIFLATGRGIQGDLPDIVTGRLIRELAIPMFKQGKIFEGVDNLLVGVIETLSPSARALYDVHRFEKPAEIPWYLWILVPVAAGGIGWNFIYRTQKKKQKEAERELPPELPKNPFNGVDHSIYPDYLGHHEATKRAQYSIDEIYAQAARSVGDVFIVSSVIPPPDTNSYVSESSSYSSSSDYSNSNSSSSSDFGSTDFAGGTFDGGGSGDSW